MVPSNQTKANRKILSEANSHLRIKAIAVWTVNRAANFPIDTDIEAEENSES